MSFVVRASRFIPLVLICTPVAAADIVEPNPAAYVQAFNETCRSGFPNLEAIEKLAVTRGWTERSISSVVMIAGNRITLPHAFSKDGLKLLLSRDAATFSVVCQVTGIANTRLTGSDIAALIRPGMNAGRGSPGRGDYKRDDLTVWDLGQGLTVEAGVNVYQRKLRTISIAIRRTVPIGAASGDSPKVKPSDDISMVAIGLPFAPEVPTPVSPSHPLFHDVAISDIQGLPATVKSSPMNFIAAAKRSSINTALSETFRQMNLLAPSARAARKRLVVTWRGDKTPFHIGTKNTTSVTIHYRLERVDTGLNLFDREITTSANGGGANASMRDNGIVRAAIAANFASAANCLDRAAFGTAPADCALTPQFSVSIVRIDR